MPENIKSEQEKLEKWEQGGIKDDGKNYSRFPKEIDQHDNEKEKNNRFKDCIGKRAFLPEQEICGTVKFLGKPEGGSKLLCGIETVTFSVLLHGCNFGKDILTFLTVMSFCWWATSFCSYGKSLFSPLYSIGKFADILGLTKK